MVSCAQTQERCKVNIIPSLQHHSITANTRPDHHYYISLDYHYYIYTAVGLLRRNGAMFSSLIVSELHKGTGVQKAQL